MSYIRPSQDALDEPFWQALARGKLMFERCSACGTFRHPPSPICARCRSFDSEWSESAGRGTLYSYTEVHHAVHPVVKSWLPYVVGLVDLAEGVRLVANIRAPHAAIRVDMALVCTIEQIAPGFALPWFAPPPEVTP